MQDASISREFEVFWKKEERSVIAVICDHFGGGSYRALCRPCSSDQRRSCRQLGVPFRAETNISTRPIAMAAVPMHCRGDARAILQMSPRVPPFV